MRIEAKVDMSESANELAKAGLKKPLHELGEGVGTVIEFFNNSFLYPLKIYNLYSEHKIETVKKQLEEKANMIPKEKLVEPSVNIVGTTLDGLKYNLDEDHIKDMFINILTADINSDKKSKVLPSYVEIVKQLSKDDAKFLKTIYELHKADRSKDFHLIITILSTATFSEGYVILDKYIISHEGQACRTIKINQVVLDNLIRLGLLRTIEGKHISDTRLYEEGFSYIKRNYDNIPINMGKVSKQDAILTITDFGLNFLEICID